MKDSMDQITSLEEDQRKSYVRQTGNRDARFGTIPIQNRFEWTAILSLAGNMH